MCRIVGLWDFKKRHIDLADIITQMRDTLSHGGPDDAGIYIDKDEHLALGHRRLSIIDLSYFGHQPMANDNMTLWVVYNGEVYNFGDIRSELSGKGCKFKSNSDTEVILKAFEIWGLDAVNKFNGMFAFAIWNSKEKELILCRDRIGVKPLYWYYEDGLFMFSSEPKAIYKHPDFRREFNEEALVLYMKYGYIPSPLSIFSTVHKLEPGTCIILNYKGEIKKIKYWNIEDYFLKGWEDRKKWLGKKEDSLIDELEEILLDSFKLRLISDVPVGVFLSGGIDSSTVCALLAKNGINLKTFTIGFYEDAYNEAPYARKIAEFLGTEHMELYCTSKEALDIITELPKIYDEPFGDQSSIPTLLLSKFAKDYVRVALSADGGDEQFCGYSKYVLVLKQAYSKAFKDLNSKSVGFEEDFIKLNNLLPTQTILEYHQNLKYVSERDLSLLGLKAQKGLNDFISIDKLDPLSSMMLLDFKTFLPDDILVKIDRSTMWVALEGREPFLDKRIVEFTSQLPAEFKCKNRESKYILKRVLYKYIPKDLVDRPKQGFLPPINNWLKNELREIYLEYLDYDKIKKEGIFNPEGVKTIISEYNNGKENNYHKLWLLLMFEMWKEKWYN